MQTVVDGSVPEILNVLAAMYGAGGGFTENINQAVGEGTVERAIFAYSKQSKYHPSDAAQVAAPEGFVISMPQNNPDF